MKTASPQEDALIQDLGNSFNSILKDYSRQFVREVTAVSHKHGLTPKQVPYIFWVLFENPENWPSLSPGVRKMLHVAIRVVSDMGSTPHYSAAFSMIDAEVEEQVDAVVADMAVWSQKVLMVGIFKGWMGLLKKMAPQVPKATRGNVSPGNSMSWLHKAFRAMLSMRQGWFDHPKLFLHLMKMFPEPR